MQILIKCFKFILMLMAPSTFTWEEKEHYLTLMRGHLSIHVGHKRDGENPSKKSTMALN